METAAGNYTLKISVIGFETDTREITVADKVLVLEVHLKTTILEFSEIQVEGLFTTRLGHESVDVVHNEKIKSIICDAQTSGGLLLSTPPNYADEIIDKLNKSGHKKASIIGNVRKKKKFKNKIINFIN